MRLTHKRAISAYTRIIPREPSMNTHAIANHYENISDTLSIQREPSVNTHTFASKHHRQPERGRRLGRLYRHVSGATVQANVDFWTVSSQRNSPPPTLQSPTSPQTHLTSNTTSIETTRGHRLTKSGDVGQSIVSLVPP